MLARRNQLNLSTPAPRAISLTTVLCAACEKPAKTSVVSSVGGRTEDRAPEEDNETGIPGTWDFHWRVQQL